MKAAKRPRDFKALELILTEETVSPHTIYFKEHSVRDHTEDRPSGRTLFVVNIPPYADEKGIINAFSEAGTATVQFCLKPSAPDTKLVQKFLPPEDKPCFRVGYLVFKTVSELDKALHLTELRPMNSENHSATLGIQKWIEQYNNSVLQPKAFKENVENFMKEFDKKVAQAEQKEKKLEQEDDEGWVTVTKRGKVQSFARTEKVENKILQKEEKKKKRKELKNFYTFQIRESKMKHIVALRQKFEEDKKKIAQIKQTRRFKPF